MRKLCIPLLGVALLAFPGAAGATVFNDFQAIYQIGNTSGFGLPGLPVVTWTHLYDGSAAPEMTAELTIVAEGVDFDSPALQENDEVYLNGTFLGQLTQQTFYNPSFDIQPGPGALGFPHTALTTSTFFFDPGLLIVGLNQVDVVVDPSNWIMEVETSSLTVTPVPEPGTVSLIAAGLIGLGIRRRKGRDS